jgi:ubiquinone/menaquinone biosynthesis C-methylase UbiE
MDLLPDRLTKAKAVSAPGVRLFSGSAGTLPLRGASFDLVVQFTVLTSILQPELKRQVALEMVRVAKPNGLILWYDFAFDNPKNPEVRGISGREIRALFAGCSVQLQRITLAPPLTRLIAGRSWLVCSLLEAVPLLRTHLLGLIRTGPE